MESREFGVVERMIHAATRANPRAAQAAISSLSRLLDGVHRSCWPEVAWSFSHLTGTGAPIEFSWSTVERAVRYTSEIAGPEADPIERLEQARRLLGELSRHSLPDDLLRQLRDLQGLGPLHYGAWVGGRHTDRGDDYKLYTEVPEGNPGLTAHFLRQHFGERAFLASRPVRFRLVGYTLGSARLEFYFRVGELHAWELGRLLDRCGLYHRLPDLLSLVKTVYGCQIGERLPGSNFGFSIARLPGQETGLFSLLAYADCVFGNDRATREAILRLAAEQGWPCDDYAAMTLPNGKPIVNHGMMAFVISETGPPALQIGFAPRVDLVQPRTDSDCPEGEESL